MAKRHRSSKTGKLVSAKYARKHKATTVAEKVKPSVRKDYLRRLIAGVRSEMNKAPENVTAVTVAGKGAISARWLDVALLCDVVEAEVIKNKNVTEKAKKRHVLGKGFPHYGMTGEFYLLEEPEDTSEILRVKRLKERGVDLNKKYRLILEEV